MKMNLKQLSWLVLVLPLRMIMGEDLPKPFSFARYQPMSDHSPFAVATTMVAPAETPNFAKDLYVANAAHSKEGDLVTIASSTDRTFKKYLTTAAPVDGYGIANIEWSDKVGATKVTITKDGQSATISFNEALLRSTAAAGQNPGPGQVPPPQKQPDGSAPANNQATAQMPQQIPQVAPGAQQNATKQMPVPVLPPNAQPPAARTRGVIPRNPTTPAVKPAPQKSS